MTCLRFIICLILLGNILLTSTAKGHIVKQLFFSLEEPGKNWKIKATFDAAYALPDLRNDENAPQPEREWLFTLNEKEHLQIQHEAETYLKKVMSFKHGNHTSKYQISFPDYQSTPPDFPSMLNGGAYITMLIEGILPSDLTNDFEIHLLDGPHPDFIVATGPINHRFYHVITPGTSATIFKTTGIGKEVIVPKSSLIGLLKMGYKHVIPDGLDHLLFILALFLMSRRWKPLLTQSLVFTLAHSITLGLAVIGAIQLNSWSGSWLIEPMIALSIAVIAVENIFTSKNSRHRLALIFFFGLIHGLGFAGSLATALDQGSFSSLVALALANLGVEFAQITILAGAWIITIKWCHSDIYPKFRITASAIIALIGLFWMVERIFLLG